MSEEKSTWWEELKEEFKTSPFKLYRISRIPKIPCVDYEEDIKCRG